MRIACVQMDVALGEKDANLRKIVSHLERLKGEGVDLAVFPEASLTGYCVSTPEDARRIAIADLVPLDSLQRACDQLDMLAVVGYAEAEGNTVYNSAVLVEPGRPFRVYRKTHLPYLGLDRFVQAGCELPVFDTRLGRIGLLICYDLRPPEATRALVLQGADIVVLPTNWPEGAETSAEFVSIARAVENRVFIVTCNRVGEEGGFRFIGRSKIIHPSGRVLAAAGSGEETISADVDLTEAREKRVVMIPDEYEVDVIGARRPELYGIVGT